MTPFVHILKSIFIGVDGRYSLPTPDAPYNYGPVLGIQLRTKVPTRVWTGTNISYMKLNGTDGYRIGAGTQRGGVNINLEYQQFSFKQKQSSTIFSLNFFF